MMQAIKDSDWKKLDTAIEKLKSVFGQDIKTNTVLPPCVGFNGGHVTLSNFKYTVDMLHNKGYSFTILEYPNIKSPENMDTWYTNTKTTRNPLVREKKLFDIKDWRKENDVIRKDAIKALDAYLDACPEGSEYSRRQDFLNLEKEDAQAFLARGKNKQLFTFEEAMAFVHEEVIDTLALHTRKNLSIEDKPKFFNILFHSEKKLYKSISRMLEDAHLMGYYSMPVCKFGYTEFKATPVETTKETTEVKKPVEISVENQQHKGTKRSLESIEQVSFPQDKLVEIYGRGLVRTLLDFGTDPTFLGDAYGAFVRSLEKDTKNNKPNFYNTKQNITLFTMQRRASSHEILTPKPRGLTISSD